MDCLRYNREMSESAVPFQPDNPTPKQRYELFAYSLKNREASPDDFYDILEAFKPPRDINSIIPTGAAKGIRVAVLGAGEAGLAAAFELRKTGCDITLFEANSQRIGGRIYTYYFDRDKKIYGELGAMRIPVAHETTWHYINLFRLETQPFATYNVNGISFIRNARARRDLKGKSVMENIYPKFKLTSLERKTPWTQLLSRVLDTPLKNLPGYITRQLVEVRPEYSPEIKALDLMTYRRAYECSGLSQEAITMLSYLSTFDESFLYMSFADPVMEQYTNNFSFTYLIKGGTSKLPLALWESLLDRYPTKPYKGYSKENLGRVIPKLGYAAKGIYYEDNNVVIEYTHSGKDESIYEKFDYVVCAIPFSSLRRMNIHPLFSGKKMQAIVEMRAFQAQKTFLLCKNRFWEMGDEKARIVGGTSNTDLPNISVVYPSDHAEPIQGKYGEWILRKGHSPYEPGALLASYNWWQDAERLGNLPVDARIRDCKRYIERIHGLPKGYMDNIVEDYVTINWTQEPWIWGAVVFYLAEHKRLFSYAAACPEYNRRVYFAGDHVSGQHGWQQGALQSGMQAANNIAACIKEKING